MVKQREVKDMNTEDLIVMFNRVIIKSVMEENTNSGLTKKTSGQHEWILTEIEQRFNINLDKIREN